MNEVIITIKAKDDASAVIDKAAKSTSGFGSALSVAVGIGLSQAPQAFGNIISGMTGAAQAAAEDEAAQLRLQKAVENTGAQWGDYKDDLDASIDASMKKAFTDDAARDSLSLLMAQTGDAGEAMERFALAQDVARGAGIPLEQASKLLGKVTEENANVFKRMGINLAEGASETEAFAALQAKFAGQADVYANSSAGQAEAAKIAMGEMREEAGSKLLPVMNKLTGAFLGLPAPIQMAGVAGKGFLSALGPMSPALMAIVPKLAGVVAGTWAHVTALGAQAVAFIAANAPIIAAAAAIALLVAGIYLLITHWDDVTAAGKKFVSFIEGLPVIGQIFKGIVDYVKGIFDQFMKLFDDVKVVAEDLLNFFKAVFSGDWQAAWDSLKKLASDALQGLLDFVKLGFMTTIGGLLASFVPWDSIKGAMEDLVSKFTGAFTAAKDWVIEHWPEIAAIISGPFFPIVALATDAFGVRTALQNGMTDLKTFVSDRVDDIVGFFTGLPGRVTTALSGLAGAMTTAFKGAFNGVIGAINSFIGFFNDLGIPSFKVEIPLAPDIVFPGFNFPDIPTIPMLARGGIVTRPTLALLGERGAEAVIPLGQGGVGRGITYNTYVTVPVQGSILSERDLERVIADAMRQGKFRGLGSGA